MSFQVSGMEGLLAQLRHMGEEGEKIKEQAEMEGAKVMQQAIKEGTPIGPHTKHARDHVEIEKTEDGVLVGYGEEHFYMLFLEAGTTERYTKTKRYKGKVSARGNVERIYNSHEKKALKAMQEAVKRELNL
ncbi:hypothetical protein B7C51_04405 [Paenibacillus larvae subsp. pulvifaciens]|uniref:Phage protein, HK97 gp10 family n=1 Tax=Paenibacillus larvae subsp. pulvifaciens TaxID=1477 RepID=A0A1V0UQI9_9BACL|nr:HK97-gp10 family putative phage morphogenesis protein [Paenibacillus larvae]ARF67218.1 hypothetical protein B7C51_04405 [Paenibacillus larvae subsp. pulvifaciens]